MLTRWVVLHNSVFRNAWLSDNHSYIEICTTFPVLCTHMEVVLDKFAVVCEFVLVRIIQLSAKVRWSIIVVKLALGNYSRWIGSKWNYVMIIHVQYDITIITASVFRVNYYTLVNYILCMSIITITTISNEVKNSINSVIFFSTNVCGLQIFQ